MSWKRVVVRIRGWLLADLKKPTGPHSLDRHDYPWWKVMCLTGVDYFSTLGYQPGIAFLAAGILSPIATFILILVTLLGALPVYRQVARYSPNGQGSMALLERLLPGWRGKALLLCLLGFAATDFIITMTLSAADATAHIIENPFVPPWADHRVGLTLILLAVLGAIFLKGFKEAIWIAVLVVGVYLSLNFVVIALGVTVILDDPSVLFDWRLNLAEEYLEPWRIFAVAALLFPKLALGLSGFETGVAVMPLVRGDEGDSAEAPLGRIRNARKLLLWAALIMSVFLMGSSVVTTLLIEPALFRPGGAANDRALAYLAHSFLGDGFGTFYDVSTIMILWFAGASAMAGLLNLVPQYLPRYGMGPEWTKASRPLVIVFTIIAVAVTIFFDADVDAQGGAYATGVLVLMTSAAVAVAIIHWQDRSRWAWALVTVIFVYTTIANIIERPEGIKIAAFFVGFIVFMSLLFRTLRSTELRIIDVVFDDAALAILSADPDQIIRLVPHRPGKRTSDEYDAKDRHTRDVHNLAASEHLIFTEIDQGDASEFDVSLHVTGVRVGDHNILRARSPAIPNALAALLIQISKRTKRLTHAYFGWTEGDPIGYIFRFLFLGEGDVAPVTREILRKAISDPAKRPFIHVG